jgi:hypothetical protein
MNMNAELLDEFLERARRSGMIDSLRSSAITMMIDADRPDLTMALQLGLSLLWEKPLLLVIKRGQKVPQRIRDLAEEIVELEEAGGLNNPTNQAKTVAAIGRMTERIRQRERKPDDGDLG